LSTSESALAPPGHELTPFLASRLIEAAKSGLFKEACARCVGISEDTLDQWLRMGLSPGATEPYHTFARTFVAQEEAQQLPHINAIKSAAAVDWRAAVAWLQLRHPEAWGAKATRNASAASLRPSAEDAEAEATMVRQLVESRPAVLDRILIEAGWTPPQPSLDKPAGA
jgi:hypothetical protein